MRHHIHDHCRRRAPGGPDIIAPRPFMIRWSGDGWATEPEAGGIETAARIWYHDIKPGNARGNDVRFTFRWQDTDQWDATDYRVDVRR